MKEFKSFIQSTTNVYTILLSVTLSLLFWIFEPSQKVPLWLFVIVAFLAFFSLWGFINSIFALKQQSGSATFTSISLCTDEICLCNPIPTLSHGSFVTIYLYRNKCEHQIGYGEVINIQDNGLISIEIHKLPISIVSNQPLPFHQILSDNKRDVRIKPTVSRKIIEHIINEEANSHEQISNS